MNRRGAIVLCGGKSSRMGTSKAMLPFGPERMLERVVRLVGEVVSLDNIAVVAASGQELPPLPAEVVIAHDRRENRGPLEGLSAGLRALESRVDMAYATSCDVPLLTPAFVKKLFALVADHEIVVPKEKEFLHPLAAVYRTGVLQAVEQLLEADRLRPSYLFDQADTLRVPVEELRDVDPELASLINCNDQEEYLQALARAGFA